MNSGIRWHAPIRVTTHAASEGTQNGMLLPDYLTWLPGEEWAVWHHVGIRGTGFPVATVLTLASPECALDSDHLLRLEGELRQAQDTILRALSGDLADAGGDTERRLLLIKAIRQVRKGRIPELLDVSPATKSAVDSFRGIAARIDEAQKSYRRVYEKAVDAISQTIREVASSEHFREAVTWQNRRALHTAVNLLLRNTAEGSWRGSKQRQHESLVASYLQRYSVKNDTIGFFGPMGWGKLVPNGDAVVMRPGPNLLASRGIYFEAWAIEALATALAKNRDLLPWMAPRRLPSVHIEGTTLRLPFRNPSMLPPEQAAVLQACNGERTARELALDAIRDPTNALSREEEVFQLLDHLCRMGLVRWTLEVPIVPNAERILRGLLERIDDEQLRQPALAALEELETARDAIAVAAGDAQKLNEALSDLEHTFNKLTGIAPTRSAGKIYAGRTLVYEDCRRDVEIEFGPQFLEALGPPLSLLLTSARWFTYEISMQYRKRFEELYQRLSQKLQSKAVDAAIFWHQAQVILFEQREHLITPLLDDFQERWAGILSISTDQRHLFYRSQDLREQVQASFRAPHPGWMGARHHSPDIMLVASSVEAIQQDDYQFVLGEIHLGANTLCGACFLAQNPGIDELRHAYQSDLPEPQITVVPPKSWPGRTTRGANMLLSPKDYRLIAFSDASSMPKSQILTIGSLVVEDCGNGLRVRTRDNQVSFDIIEAFADILSFLVLSSFSFKELSPDSHVPRISIDRLVVTRESWRFYPKEVPFATEKDEANRFIQARRWMRAHDIPRFIFVKVPVESKPFYVDVDSPIYIDNLAKAVRKTADSGSEHSRITITEMLPNPEQTWLRDAAGQHYTSELRLVAVDRSDASEPANKS